MHFIFKKRNEKKQQIITYLDVRLSPRLYLCIMIMMEKLFLKIVYNCRS